MLIAADEEGGIITRVEARTGSSYPGNGALGAVGDTGLTRRVAASIGAMLAAGGVNLDLAPTADIDSNPANPVIGVRSFGADPSLVAAHTANMPLPGPPYVVDAGGRMSSLLGDRAGSLLGVLRERDPAVDGVWLTGPSAELGGPGDRIVPAGPDGPVRPDGPVGPAELEAMIARGASRPLVLAVRDAHRRAWQRELVGRVLARRPDTVVVGTGTEHDRDLARGSYLGTRGAGRANLAAAADVLLGRNGHAGRERGAGPG